MWSEQTQLTITGFYGMKNNKGITTTTPSRTRIKTIIT